MVDCGCVQAQGDLHPHHVQAQGDLHPHDRAGRGPALPEGRQEAPQEEPLQPPPGHREAVTVCTWTVF